MRTKLLAAAVFIACLASFVISSEQAGSGKPPMASPMVGAQSCQTCHPQQYASWKKTTHSSTADKLGEMVKDPACAKCHTTGLGLPGGFVPEQLTANMQNVQCEACHGGGTVHLGAGMDMKKRSISVNGLDCRTCHKPHSDHSKI